VRLPQTPGLYVIPGFPRVARRVLDLLGDNSSVEGRMLRNELSVALKMPGREDSVGVFNRRDYLASGGEPLADLAETLLLEAAGGASV
jgi:Mn-containing catalase